MKICARMTESLGFNERERTWKNNNQSTNHIDPKAGAGGKLCVLAYLSEPAHMVGPLPVAREKSGTCLQCVWQRSTRSIETLRVFQPKPVDFNSQHNPSQAFPKKHVSYPWLTATIVGVLSPPRLTLCSLPEVNLWLGQSNSWLTTMALF